MASEAGGAADRNEVSVAGIAPATGTFAGRVLTAIAVLAVVVLVWQLRGVVLLVFAGILFAIVFDSGARLIERWLPIRHMFSLALATVAIIGLAALAVAIFGREVVRQITDLVARLPGAWASLETRVGSRDLAATVREHLGQVMPDGGTVLAAVQYVVGSISSAGSGFALALLGGIYFAARPALYRRGFLLLVPDRHVARMGATLDASRNALQDWLLGQLLSMSLTAIAITLGLTLIGVPSALALGLICGLMGFVPMIGPLLGALPGVLVALSIGGDVLWQTIILYVIVQQLAGSVIEPMIMHHTVNVPPAVTLFGLFAVGALLGPVGVLLGGPIIVTVHVLVRQLYVKGCLGRELTAGSG
ncbi:MAG TPA: AI-2E family transporter [Croceibacterium sp.]